MNAPTPQASLLVASIRAAKAAETAAHDERVALEAQLVSLHPPVSAGAEETFNGEGYSIAFKVTRKVDADALFDAFPTLPANAKKAFRFKADVALTQYRALAEFDPASYDKVTSFVTTTPAKPTVTLKD